MSDDHKSKQVSPGEELNHLLRGFGRENDNVERIQEIITKNPELVKQECAHSRGQLPLHVAVMKNLPLSVVQQLILLYPNALAIRDGAGCLPLHIICKDAHFGAQNTMLLLTLQSMISLYPNALATPDNEGRLPLHIACSKRHAFQVLQKLVSHYPEALSIQDNEGCLPLHIACRHNVGDEALPVIQFLVESYSAGVSTSDSSGFTPLYHACGACSWYDSLMSDAPSLAVIQFLYQAYPQAAMQASNGETPLHCICQTTRAVDRLPVARFLIEACPESVSMVTTNGHTPLHSFCKDEDDYWEDYEGDNGTDGDNDFALAKLLVEQCPEALVRKDHAGHHTPLHWEVCRPCLNINIVRYLAEKCTNVLEADDEEGDGTPLHEFCYQHAHGCDHGRLYCLEALAISEKAVKARDGTGQTPFHVLCYMGSTEEFLDKFLDKCAELLHMRDSKGRIALHLAVKGAADFSRWDNKDYESYYAEIYHLTIAYLLKAFPGGVQIADNDGMTPLELACEKNVSLNLIYQLVRTDPVMNLSCFGESKRNLKRKREE